MKYTRKLSPFQELLKALENEAFIKSIEFQAHPEKFDSSWLSGYMTALNNAINKAYAIYNRSE